MFWPSLAIALAYVAFGAMVLSLFGPGFEHGYPVLVILSCGQLASAVVGPVAREDFWLIVAFQRSEDETEIRAGESAGGTGHEGYPPGDTAAFFG